MISARIPTRCRRIHPLLLASLAGLSLARAAEPGPPNTIVVRADQGRHVIHRDIYGHFSEHLGRCICEFQGWTPRRASGRVLTADAINAHNTFDQPDRVRPVALDGVTVVDGQVRAALPPKSVAVIELEQTGSPCFP